jgi:hypothetical protein
VRWKLSNAVLRCSARRMRGAIVREPFAAAVAVALLLALPALGLLLGRQVAPLIAAAATNTALANAFAASVVGPALLLGVGLGALAPADRLLGPQLTAAPVTPLTRFTTLTVVPLAVLSTPLAAPAVAWALAATDRAAAGRWLAPTLVTAFASALLLGAALSASVTAAVRRPRLVPLAPGIVGLWLATGAWAGEPFLGPGAQLARAVPSGATTAAESAVVCLALAALALATWAGAAALAPQARPARGHVRLSPRLPRRPRIAFGIAVNVRLARHAQIRRHVAFATMFALGTTLTIRLVGVGEAGTSYLPLAAALVAAAAVPPAAFALASDAPWLLRAAPVRAAAAARATACAAVLAAAVTIVVVVAAASPVASLEAAAWPLAETSAAAVLAAAVAGGSLVPWRPDRVAEQIASYVVVGTIAAALSYGLALGAAEAAVLGVPEAVFAAVAANVAVVASIGFAGLLAR